MKRCTKCNASKPISAFHKNPSKTDGRDSQCAECRNAKQRKDRAEIAVAGVPHIDPEIAGPWLTRPWADASWLEVA